MKDTPDDSELRRRAEEKLKETIRGSENLSGVSSERMATLIHELQVHQIELEMQNDELRRIQGELENSRDKYSHLYDFAPTGYFTLSEKGIIEEANLVVASMMGVERLALIGKPLTRFVMREDQDIFYKHWLRLSERETPQLCELRLENKDGREFHARLECIIINNKGAHVKQIRAAVSDVTARTRAEEAFRQSETRYRSFIKLTEQIEWTTNADGLVVEDLHSWREFTGQSEEEIKGWGWLKALHPDDLEHTAKAWKKSIAKKSNYEVEYRVRRYDGVYRHFLARGVPLSRADGSIYEWTGVCIDISARKEMEKLLRRSHDELDIRVQKRTGELVIANTKLIEYNQRLEELNKELHDFAFVASHDLQEPLRKVRTFGEMLAGKSAGALDETSMDYIRRMQNAAERMQNLLKSLLSYSRLSTHAESLKEMDLGKSVDKALSNLKIIIKEKNAHIEVGTLPTVTGDQVQMIQLFQNLIGNALKFIRKGEIPHVKLRAREARDASGAYEIWVEDNGIGFEMRYLDRIFLPFQRLHGRSSHYEGMGMGLAICRKIVERHGGKITARSKPGKGSTFIVTLPAERKMR